MSQVDYLGIPHNWEYSIDNAPVIVLARRSGPPKQYREWVFPRETHFTQSEETVAREWAQPYEVLEVIRPASGRPLGSGQEILVWQHQEYSWEDLEYYHRTGIIHSAIILVQEAVAESQNGRVLLFLEEHEEVWRRFNDAPEEGELLLERRPRKEFFQSQGLMWHFENRRASHPGGIAWWVGQGGLIGVHALRPADGTYLEERRGLWRLLPEDWEVMSPLIRETDWSRLEFKGELKPDETLPRVDVPGAGGGSWLVHGTGTSPEVLAHRRILGTLQSHAEGLPWIRVREDTVDFGWRPGALW